MSYMSDVLYFASLREKGRADALKWLENPAACSLTDLRVDFQDELMAMIEEIDRDNADFSPNLRALFTAMEILDHLNEYAAGVDQVLTEVVFVRLRLPMAQGANQ